VYVGNNIEKVTVIPAAAKISTISCTTLLAYAGEFK
jgi:hypothetical protein